MLLIHSSNWKIFKFIEVKSNALFLSTFGVKIDVKNKRKRVSSMCENAYLSIKNPKASRALKWALDPGHRMLASLARLHFAMSATFGLRSWGPPLDQILDPHLNVEINWISREARPGLKLHKFPFITFVVFNLSKKTTIDIWAYFILSLSCWPQSRIRWWQI